MSELSPLCIRLGLRDVPAAARVLSRAFNNYPLLRYCLPDAQKRSRRLHILYEAELTYGVQFGHLIADSPALHGVLIYYNADAFPFSNWHMIRAGSLCIPLVLGFDFARKHNTITDKYLDLYSHYAPRPNIYLWDLGVDPPYQGQGFGGKLIRYVLEEAASKQIPIYLETAVAKNVKMYETFGFKVVTQIHFEDAQMDTWGLVWNKFNP